MLRFYTIAFNLYNTELVRKKDQPIKKNWKKNVNKFLKFRTM